MNNDVELIPVKGVLPSVQVQSDNVIYVPQAHKNKAGIVKEGDGVLIENGVVSLNRQTVEDMIDANKWVSYGFQQNLTEDEKGMARHNIGAGDNYFTGSYYDLTQKPHLNTNNTAGLDYGDEELNDTINLHKISKTGSFNDLRHVPQETIDFAESERQKSKNLFPNETVSGTRYTKITLPSPLKVGTYTLSSIATSSDTDVDRCVVSFQGDSDKFLGQANLGRNTRTNSTITLSETCYYINFYAGTSYANSAGDTFTYSDIQIEEGSVATDYQPYNGAIVHDKEIADVEHIETIYDKTSSDANINKGLTSGIPFDNTTELNLGENLSSKYKGTYVYITIWNMQLRIYCDIAYSQERYSFLGYDINSGDNKLVMGCVSIAKSTGILKGIKLISGDIGGSTYSTLTDGKYNIYKVEGVLL